MFKLLTNCHAQAFISSISKIPRGPLPPLNFAYNTCISPKVSSSIKIGTYSVRRISTSQPRHYNPLLVFLVRPIGRALFLVLGKLGKRSWKRLPQEKKIAFFNHFKSNKYLYAGVCAYITGGLLVAYERNVSYCPITSKRRFKLFSSAEIEKNDAVAFRNEFEREYKNKLLPVDSRQAYRVRRVGKRLVQCNEILQKTKWEITLVKDDSTVNAHALSDGNLIVYSGILNLCQSDDELATILAHEMAHVVLEHGNLKLSRYLLIEFFLWPLIFCTWLMMPGDIISLFFTQLYGYSSEYSFNLAYSRDMELEADFLGLLLLTNACYDGRKSAELWKTVHENDEMMKISEDTEENIEETSKNSLSSGIRTQLDKWSSTHPPPLYRHQQLKKCSEHAIKLRSCCGCPPLKSNGLLEQEVGIMKTLNRTFKTLLLPISR